MPNWLTCFSFYLMFTCTTCRCISLTQSSHLLHHFCVPILSLPVLLLRSLSVFQVRVCTYLQWPVGTGKSSSECSISITARRANEHFHQSDTRRMDVRQHFYTINCSCSVFILNETNTNLKGKCPTVISNTTTEFNLKWFIGHFKHNVPYSLPCASPLCVMLVSIWVLVSFYVGKKTLLLPSPPTKLDTHKVKKVSSRQRHSEKPHTENRKRWDISNCTMMTTFICSDHNVDK